MKKLMTLFIVLSLALMTPFIVRSLWLVPSSIGQDEAEAAPTPAKSAYEFTNSVGVMVHLAYLDTAYGPHWSAIGDRLAEAKIKHVRDGAVWSANADEMRVHLERLHSMAAKGIKFQIIFEPRSRISNENLVREVLAGCGSDCESAEGPNEKDWWTAERMRSFQSEIYNAIKSIRPEMPVGAPSYTGNPETYAMHGNYEDIADFGNIHPYPGGLHPEKSPDVFQGNMDKVRMQSPNEPIRFTETGYHNGTTRTLHPGVPLDVAATYAPRLFLFDFKSGVDRTYWYEAINQSASTDQEQNWGLLDHNAQPKPAYTAIKNTMLILDDPNGQNFNPGSLDYTISGDTADVHHVLLQKSNGKFYLAVWQGVSVYDRFAQTRLSVPSKSVNLTFATNMTQIRVYKPNRQATPIRSFSNTAQISQSIQPRVKVYEITR